MIIIEPTSGLCSRIFVLCDAYELAKQLNQSLVILWLKTADCNCHYYDIFDESQFEDITCKVIEFDRYERGIKDTSNFKSFQGFTGLLKELFRRVRFGLIYYPVRLYYRSRCSIYKNAYQDENAALDSMVIRNHNSFIEAYNGITHKHKVSSAKFSKKIQQEAIQTLESTQGNCVGVHIRRTDHELAKGSLTDNFIERMKELLEKDRTLYFYLATDDWNEQERLIQEFGERIIVQKNKVLTRSTQRGMHSSVIDLLCLSKTRFILGSYSSMFSEFSAKLGGIELIII